MSTEALLDIMWILLCAGFVFLMQGGFLCLESGVTRSKNSINVAFKNIVDFGLAVLLYWVISYGLMFGSSAAGWVGTDGFFYTISGEEAPFQYSVFIFQAMFCATGATIISGATAERLRFYAYLFITAVFSVLVYPFVGHWVWATDYLGNPSGWLAEKGFLDFAGSSVVHSTGGWVSLALLILVGPRLGRFDDKGKAVEIPGSNMPLAMLGTTLLVFGWFGFNGGSTLSFGGGVPLILMNTLLGAVGGMTVVLGFIPITKKLPDPGLVMNGAIAGLVGVTANCNLTGPVAAIIIGAVAGVIMLGTVRLLEYLKIDDAVGAIPAHLTPGIWGTLAVAFFADAEVMGLESVDRMSMFETQFIGVIVIGFWSFCLSYVLFYLIKKFVPLRVSAEEEHAGLNISEHNARTETLFLLQDMEMHARTGDLSKRVRVEPFTEVGQIARQYNKVIDTLDLTMSRLKSIFQDLHDGIITFNSEGNVLSMNPAAGKFYGLEPAMAGGLSAWDLLVPESRDDLEVHQPVDHEPFDPFRAGVMQEIHYFRKNSRKDEVVEFVASKGSFNNEVIYTGLIRDVSETVQTKRSKSRLMSKLVGAQQSQFYAGMCKQSVPVLRNLSKRIYDLSLSLPRTIPDPRLKTLENDAQEILHLTDDLRYVEMQGSLPVKEVALAPFLENFLQNLVSEAKYPEFGETKLSIDLDDNSLQALVAPSALEQVLEILLLLSCRESGVEKGVVVKLESCYLDHPLSGTEVIPAGEYLTLHLVDEGEGIPEAELDEFFEGRDRKYKDIDLAMAESMVRHMNGFMDVDSTLGEGTTLSIYLPIARDLEDPGEPEEAEATVMLIDDHRPITRLVSGLLHKIGYKVLTAETGDRALAKMKETAVDVVLLDLILAKDLQAREYTFRQIHERYPEIPILVSGGEVDAQVLATVIQEGAAGFLEKPYVPSKLLHMVKREAMAKKNA
ncbi:ammonium transporter [Kiritimatiellaeota bacterium B1221]|nr:ammonium transporter [Kiritimatiellaeota bacterium B1221]